ncbi:gfo/Idh/MocA family oxidoreductase [Iocasia frigidifontis]|uniref:Gfo/Idh/MocA family oxidoreductase n=1 Tax=Iocasia fonsfrigidae TaxID=2682810 RepID=A0A8A7KIY8_9FIRM|nr:gfo/Idh/MocA family oxidoreductase [Iocasia fonsfrigidae]
MKKIRLAVIGTGMAWKRLHWPAIQELGDHYQIVAVCNKTKSDAVDFAREINLAQENVYDDYKEMLKRGDIDAVDVMVPIPENFDIYHDIVTANINLIAEKPLASTMEGAEKLLKLHKKHPVNIMVAENYRYNDEINKIRDIINQGKIGDVIYFINHNAVDFENQMTKNTFAATEWRQHPQFKGGTFLDAGLHDIAAMRHIFGKVDYVYAMGQPQQEDFSPYISVNSQIKFSNGVIGQYSYYTDGKETQRPLIGFRIFGNKGEIYLEERRCGTINITYRDGGSEQITYRPERGYFNELLNFYNSLLGNEEIAVTPEVEYGDVKMVFNILKSIKDNKAYPVDTKTNEISLV